MKIVIKNSTLEFQRFKVQILDHKENVTCTSGGTSTASNIDTVIERKYGALLRLTSIVTSGSGTEPYPHFYEGAGAPALGTTEFKQTTAQNYRDYYMTGGEATRAGKIGVTCSSAYTITYDVIFFDITAHPGYEALIPEWDFDEISAMIE